MCSGRVATPTTSLLALMPDVAKRWHPTRNGKLSPDKVKPQAKRQVWWLCPKDLRHEWEAPVAALGKCPICVGKVVVFANSLAACAKSIVKEWHPTKNGDRKPEQFYRYSLVRVFWGCMRDRRHEWEATIASRVKRGGGCPYCGHRVVGLGTSLAAQCPDIAAEWHPDKNGQLTADDVVPGAAAKAWWRCAVGHEWQTRICSRGVKKTGCRQCFFTKHRIWLAENNRLRAKKHPGAAG
jgi:hypothetical protein